MITIFDIFDRVTGKTKGKPKKPKKEEEKKEPEKKDYSKEVQENVSIHVMPERFRVVQKQKTKAKTTGILIIIGGILILAVVSFLLYYYLLKPSPPEIEQPAMPTEVTPEEPASIVPTTPETPEEEILEPAAKQDPKDSYMKIKIEFDAATIFDEFDDAIQKYGSKNKIAIFEIEKRELENQPASFKDNTISLVIQNSTPKLSEIGDIIAIEQGDLATINATTKDLKRDGVIKLVFEDDEWKLDSEVWEDIEEEVEVPVILSVGLDSDRDGFTDKEELVFNTDISNSDSDGDGYNDLSELINLYNPAGEGELEDSDSVEKYNNSVYDYSLLYPKNWTMSSVGGGETILFKSSDNHFVQIVSQANTGKQLIEDWYKTQFSVAAINNSQKVSKNIWQGVKSDDGLTIYITDSGLNNIYIITYNLGSNNIIEYKNVFELAINSFEIGSF